MRDNLRTDPGNHILPRRGQVWETRKEGLVIGVNMVIRKRWVFRKILPTENEQ